MRRAARTPAPPAAGATARSAVSERIPLGHPPGTVAELPGIRVLAVDDEPLLVRLLGRILENAGCRVVAAADAHAARAAFEAEPGGFDAVVVDAGIPPQGAAPLLRELLALRPETGVVSMSGAEPEPELRELVEGAGGVFVRKPFDAGALLRALEEVARPGPSV